MAACEKSTIAENLLSEIVRDVVFDHFGYANSDYALSCNSTVLELISDRVLSKAQERGLLLSVKESPRAH